MKNFVTYAVLKRLLERLGFREVVLPGGHLVFRCPAEKDLLLIYRAYRPRERLEWIELIKTRAFLDAWGLVEKDAFGHLLQDVAGKRLRLPAEFTTLSEHVPYATLKKMLQALGFTETVVPGSRIVFNHAEPNTLLVYRYYKPREKVSPRDLFVTRLFLDQWGLVEADSFEEVLGDTTT